MQGWGVRATLDGRKSQTRRVAGLDDVNANPNIWHLHKMGILNYKTKKSSKGKYGAYFHTEEIEPGTLHICPQVCPYGQPGDFLWIRETWAESPYVVDDIIYKADGVRYEALKPKWKPSIFMPKAAARIWRRITDIRVERVQDISEADAQAEGIEFRGGYWLGGIHPIKGTLQCWPTAKIAFPRIWDSINKKPKLAKRNPWTRAPEDCYVSYPWEDIQETRQHRGLTWYVIGNPYVWAISSEKADR